MSSQTKRSSRSEFEDPLKIAMHRIRVIDNSSWLIGDSLVLSHTHSGQSSWGDGHGGGYTISNAPSPLPETFPLPANSKVRLYWEFEARLATYFIGDAILKIRALDFPNGTRENITLAWLHKRSWSFSIPDVIHYSEHNGFYYLAITRPPGEPLNKIWCELDESLRQQYAERVVEICKELAIPSHETRMVGVDGNVLGVSYLSQGGNHRCDPLELQQSCQELGMDCSKLVFQHCLLGTHAIIVDQKDHSFSIWDWEVAGFLPVEWIRTNYRVCAGLGLEDEDLTKDFTDAHDFRRRVHLHMGSLGYTDVMKEFAVWHLTK